MAKPTILAVCGTRPDAIKMAPVVLSMREHEDWEVRFVASGQHREILQQALDFFGLTPDRNYALMQEKQTLNYITVSALNAMESAISDYKPQLVIAQGDTTTTLCAAVQAFYNAIPFAHVEAGLRTPTIHRPFPEEFNRRTTSLITELHFAPTRKAAENLLREGVSGSHIFITGNTSIDAVLAVARKLPEWNPFAEGRMLLVTTHRRENWGEPQRRICRTIVEILRRFPDCYAVIPMHPNRMVREVLQECLSDCERVFLIEPPDYPGFVQLMKNAYLILSDSGGVQEEAPSLGKPVLVLREETERPEGIEAGAATLVGTSEKMILEETSRLLTSEEDYCRMAKTRNPYGDGRSSKRIVNEIRRFLGLSFAEIPLFEHL